MGGLGYWLVSNHAVYPRREKTAKEPHGQQESSHRHSEFSHPMGVQEPLWVLWESLCVSVCGQLAIRYCPHSALLIKRYNAP